MAFEALEIEFNRVWKYAKNPFLSPLFQIKNF